MVDMLNIITEDITKQSIFLEMTGKWHSKINKLAKGYMAVSGSDDEGSWEDNAFDAAAFRHFVNVPDVDNNELADTYIITIESLGNNEKFNVEYPLRVYGNSKAVKVDICVHDAVITSKLTNSYNPCMQIKVFDSDGALQGSYNMLDIDTSKLAEKYTTLNNKLMKEAILKARYLNIKEGLNARAEHAPLTDRMLRDFIETYEYFYMQ